MSGDLNYDKSFRLLSVSDFRHLRRCSRFVKTKYFMAYCQPTLITGSSKSRLGIVVSKKFGIAVVRNKIKRYIREFFRTSSFRFTANDILVVPSRALASRLSDGNIFGLISCELQMIFEKVDSGESS